MNITADLPVQAAIVEPLTFIVKGFRIDGAVSPIDVRVTHISDNLSQIVAGATNFRTKHRYFVGGHLLCIRFGLADGAQLNESLEPVWAGVRGARRIIDRTTHEMLIEADAEDTLHVYYPDGVVVEVKVTKDGVTRTLAPEAALEKRLDFVESSFAKVADFTDADERARKQDRNFHELASLLLLTAFHPYLREKVIRTVGTHTKRIGGRLNKGVRRHFLESLEEINDRTDYWWLTERSIDELTVTRGPIRYGDPLPALSAVRAANAKKVDGELHGMISEAMKSPSKWPAVRDELKRRSLADELRPGVRHRFCLQCTDSALTDEVSKYPIAVKDDEKRGPSPLGSKSMTREERIAYEKRRDGNRKARLGDRPARGSSPSADPHAKGGKGKQDNKNKRK